MERFQDQVVLITGGTSGIGREAARRFAAEGALVVVCGRRAAEGTETMRILREYGNPGEFVPCDVSQASEVRTLIDGILERHGRLDVAVNNAGISPRRHRITDVAEADFDRVMAVNVKGVFLCLQHEIRVMRPTGRGVIVNTASVLGLKAMDLNHALYTASKHAVVGLTKAAALETAASGLRINAVCPGGVDTPIHEGNTGTDAARQAMAELHPMRRLAAPGEVAQAILFLCSQEASFITGASLSVDGGVSAG